jgi:hypothetical protein
MAESWQAAAEKLVTDLKNVFGERLHSVVCYGPRLEGPPSTELNALALVASLTMPDLEACANRMPNWARAGVATPLLLTRDEFHRSLDAFPLEFNEIIRSHAPAFGADPFAGAAIAAADLRRACETQIKSHLLHLREGFMEAAGRPVEVGRLVSASAPAFSALLRNVARLGNVTTTDRMTATRAGAQATGVPDAIVTDLLALEQAATVPTTDPARLFPAYLSAVEQLARAVDTWRV